MRRASTSTRPPRSSRRATGAKAELTRFIAGPFANSLCLGAYADGEQVGFARVVTDYACFAYVADVIVWPDRRGLGIGKKLVQAVLDHPELASVTGFSLRTSDAHSLYEKFGFVTSTDGMYMRLARQPATHE